jgi:hypothetical protein
VQAGPGRESVRKKRMERAEQDEDRINRGHLFRKKNLIRNYGAHLRNYAFQMACLTDLAL